MLSDLKLVSGGSEVLGRVRRRSSSPKEKKSSLFTVDSLLAGGSHHHQHKDSVMVHDYSDLSPPATPPSPAVHKPMPMPNSPLFAPYPFGYPGNLLIPGLPFPHPASIHSWSGIKFPPSNHLNDAPTSKYLVHIIYKASTLFHTFINWAEKYFF